jgi:hypothetical protein
MAPESLEQIRHADWNGLHRLWRRIELGETQPWPEGAAFEHLVLRAFELSGCTVVWPYRVGGLEQLDGMVTAGPIFAIVESKDRSNPVSVEPIAKLRNQLLRRHSMAIGLLFSRHGLTGPAQVLVNFLAPQCILVWTGDDVAFCLGRRNFRGALEYKYRYAVQYAENVQAARLMEEE